MENIIDTCKGWNCPIKHRCYRHELYKTNKNRAYEEPPFEISGNHIKCNRFWSINDKPSKQCVNKVY